MNHVFSEVPKINIPRSVFNRPSTLKTTINTDYLYPIYCDEALPGDTFKMTAQFFGRMTNPIIRPMLDDMYLDTFFFAIPVRLVDSTFKRLMGDRPFGDIRNDYTTPVLNTGDSGVAVESLSDYIGIPVGVPNLDFVPWWHRAYNLCYNEWFRDENLCSALPVSGVHEDGTVSTESLSDYVLVKRGKRKDYFTGCLPWPQKGETTAFSLGDSMVVSNYADNHFADADEIAQHSFRPRIYDGNGNLKSAGALGVSSDPGLLISNDTAISSGRTGAWLALEGSWSTNALISINQLREAFAIQHLLERDALGGSRYTEIVRAHFNIYSPDGRQQRPEYLGGSSTRLNVTSVAQTANSLNVGGGDTIGQLGAFVTVGDICHWQKTFTEHTIILGLANIRADLHYMQGLNRMFSRRTKYDFYWPELANLSEQPVLNKEIYAQGSSVVDDDGHAIDDGVFGYQERWAEYRYKPSQITGKLRPSPSVQSWASLFYWHLGQNFANLPKLNSTFVNETVPISRICTVDPSDEPPFLLDATFDLKCARPMPVYSVPGLSRM